MNGSHNSSRSCASCLIESLEQRRLLSAQGPAIFAEAMPVQSQPAIMETTRASDASLDSSLVVQTIRTPGHAVRVDGYQVVGQKAAVRIVNEGVARATGGVSLELYLSSDKMLDGTDVLAGVVTNKAIRLGSGKSHLFSAQLRPTPTLALGQYYLFAVATPIGRNVQPATVASVKVSTTLVAVNESRLPIHHHRLCYEECYDGTVIDDSSSSGGEDLGGAVDEEIPTPSDLPPATPVEPTSPPTTDPTTEPTGNPTGNPTTGNGSGPTTRPTTNPTTKPGSGGSTGDDGDGSDSGTGDAGTGTDGGDDSGGSGGSNAGGDDSGTDTGGDDSGTDTGGDDSGTDSGGDNSGTDSGSDDSGGDTSGGSEDSGSDDSGGGDSGSDDSGGDDSGDSGGADFSGDDSDDSGGGDFSDDTWSLSRSPVKPVVGTHSSTRPLHHPVARKIRASSGIIH